MQMCNAAVRTAQHKSSSPEADLRAPQVSAVQLDWISFPTGCVIYRYRRVVLVLCGDTHQLSCALAK